MKNNVRRIYTILYNICEVCYRKGVSYAILCPGSRSAPLALSFLRNKKIKCYIINDERSAAYIALGIARSTGNPVAIVSTSGTAALNFAPAVAEAYFQRVPLIVFTADRPNECVGQGENQTIYQRGIYEPNVLKSYHLNIVYEDNEAENEAYRITSDALNKTMIPEKGPVHINVPLREPLYDYNEGHHHEEDMPKMIDVVKTEDHLPEDIQKELLELLHTHKKIVLLAGQYMPDKELKMALNTLLEKTDVVFIPSLTSNLQSIDKSILQAELILNFVGEDEMEYMQPNLLISFGGPMISKSLISFLRKYKPTEHWCIDHYDRAADTYQSLTKIIPVSPVTFIKFLTEHSESFKDVHTHKYFTHWEAANKEAREDIQSTLEEGKFNELYAVSRIISFLPPNSNLHLSNSMTIRLGAAITLRHSTYKDTIRVFSNRGTSGIDGCFSTAMGTAFVSKELTTLIVGDLGFFYDRNALWNNYLPANLKVIVLNNHGGGIFKTLEGPSKLPEFEEYFITKQPLNIEDTVLQHKARYILCNDIERLDSCLEQLYLNNDKTTVLEIDFAIKK